MKRNYMSIKEKKYRKYFLYDQEHDPYHGIIGDILPEKYRKYNFKYYSTNRSLKKYDYGKNKEGQAGDQFKKTEKSF